MAAAFLQFWLVCLSGAGELPFRPLAKINEIDATDGKTVSLSLGIVPLSVVTGAASTRGYNGQVPGPTIRTRPGATLKIELWNDLPPEKVSTMGAYNTFRAFDTTSLHVHGLHVSSREGHDNIFAVIPAKTALNYTYQIASDHMPGTHWYHPHFHGSTSVQAGGGAAGRHVAMGGRAVGPIALCATRSSLACENVDVCARSRGFLVSGADTTAARAPA